MSEELKLRRICSECNKSFEITSYGETVTDIHVTFMDCPHCKARNDIWIEIIKNTRPSPWILADDPPECPNWEEYYYTLEEFATVPRIMQASNIWLDEDSEVFYYQLIELPKKGT